MSSITSVEITCDGDKCQQWGGSHVRTVGTLEQAEQRARELGWTVEVVGLGLGKHHRHLCELDRPDA